MDCPLLSSSHQKPCRSTSNWLAHTVFLSTEYCKGIWFTLCPLFRQQRFTVSLLAGTAAPAACSESPKGGTSGGRM